MRAESSCPECGASQRQGTCREQLRRALLDELPDGDAAQALAVACFTLQHAAAQTPESLVWARFHLEGSVAPPLGREGVRARASRRVAAMSSVSPPRPPGVPISVVWRVTVADLSSLPRDSIARAHAWAHATLADLRRA